MSICKNYKKQYVRQFVLVDIAFLLRGLCFGSNRPGIALFQRLRAYPKINIKGV